MCRYAVGAQEGRPETINLFHSSHTLHPTATGMGDIAPWMTPLSVRWRTPEQGIVHETCCFRLLQASCLGWHDMAHNMIANLQDVQDLHGCWESRVQVVWRSHEAVRE